MNKLMQSLDPKTFSKTFQALGIRVPAQKCSELLKKYSHYLVNIPKYPNIVKCEDSDSHRLLLVKSDLDLPDELLEYESLPKQITLGYQYFSSEEVLKAVMPPEVVVPTGFETIGHIAHYNLLQSQLPYKHTIGQVTIDVLFT